MINRAKLLFLLFFFYYPQTHIFTEFIINKQPLQFQS